MPASPLDPVQLIDLSAYVGRLRKLPGVQHISSLVSIDPRIPSDGYTVFYSMDIPEAKMAKARFMHDRATILFIDYAGESQDPATQKLLRAVRGVRPPAGATVLVGGDTAELVDRLDSLRSHLPLAGSVILGATFLLLCFMLSSLFVPIKALLLNVLSLSASFGLMTWIFQDGHLQRALDFTSSRSLDANLPVLIFALAFGLSTDYEVFLVSRIKEEYRHTGNNTEAVALGVEKTAEIITSAALLLIVVVAAFGASKILPMKEIGVGLSIAIAIDATVVRMLLVPATMHVFGDLNWWLPPFARKMVQRTHSGDPLVQAENRKS
jgi:RND superfamily putative drug exporter